MTKLPGQPKRYMSAYFIWMNGSREEINKKYPNMSVSEFAKKAGEIWKGMDGEKAVSLIILEFPHSTKPPIASIVSVQEWEAKAVEDRKRYEAALEKWKSEGGLQAMKDAKLAKKAEKRRAKAAVGGGGGGAASTSKKSATKKRCVKETP
jgi:hypothetical protein